MNVHNNTTRLTIGGFSAGMHENQVDGSKKSEWGDQFVSQPAETKQHTLQPSEPLPEIIQEYADDLGVALHKNNTFMPMEGHDVYTGLKKDHNAEQMVVFYHNKKEKAVPAQFVLSFKPEVGEAIVNVTYRGSLPAGSGKTVMAHLITMGLKNIPLKTITMHQVVNVDTLDALIVKDENSYILQKDRDPVDTTLGRVANGIATLLGCTINNATCELSKTGDLDIHYNIAQ